ncbi:GNAT family N-acetyltransferase [Ulvibacter antarcticus]|uniref:Ribosomal-protein-alanine N-acetyltransferase n=1 Tax=Ulvibacter antarcticus TaxID=442714 RepID=A0A3L9ZGR1_9FLAO|nr:GNAT family N-acetyltransferase [Ulvibacter antarcticus]RMA65912.1 ribosomal-protein-alanine N-acetyltransferase [Ulvibacter antarcticus]
MYKSDTFSIFALKADDAYNLNALILENMDHFGKYLPITVSKNLTVKASEAYIQKKKEEYVKKTCITFGIEESQTGKIAGLIILKNIELKKKEAEFAYCMAASFGGRGWMSMAVEKMIEYAQDEFGIAHFKVITHKTNIGSCKVAEKTGFIWKKTLLKEFRPKNFAPMDMELYERSL